MSQQEVFPIDYPIVLRNMDRPLNARMNRQIDELDINADRQILPTSTNPNQMIETIYAAVKRRREQATVFIAGGDGTANLVISSVLSEVGMEIGLNKVPVVPLRGGNANDIATMLNGWATAKQILKHGRRAELRPLKITTKEKALLFALGYCSIGATASAAEVLDAADRNNGLKHKIKEVNIVLRETANYPQFRYSPERDERGLMVNDLAFFRGSRIAKYGHPRANLNIVAFDFQADNTKDQVHVLGKLGRMGTGLLKGEKITDNMSFRIGTLSDDFLENIMQYDGETVRISANNQVNVGLAQNSYTTLTTKPTRLALALRSDLRQAVRLQNPDR